MVAPQLTLPVTARTPFNDIQRQVRSSIRRSVAAGRLPYPFAGVNSRWRFVRPWRK